MNKALITGASGQDGAYLAKFLLEKGYEVHGLSPRRSTENIWRMEYFNIQDDVVPITGDVTCSSSVSRIVADGEYDEIYNLAAQSFVGESFNSPTSTFAINAGGTLNLLEAIRMHSPWTKFYQASTSELFGKVNKDYQNEDTPFHPRSPYAVSKLAAHWSTINYRESYDLFACCGILFNHESPLRGKEFVTRKITDGVAKIVAGETKELRLGNLDAKRDWGHAEDYVEAMWLMLQQEKPKDYVIATGSTYSVRDFVKCAFDTVGLDYEDYVVVDEAFKRPAEVNILCGDAMQAALDLGWAATKQLGQTIADMLEADFKRHGLELKDHLQKEDVA